jgi:flagellum-specific peptidoglycan hydrolase FlgJ
MKHNQWNIRVRAWWVLCAFALILMPKSCKDHLAQSLRPYFEARSRVLSPSLEASVAGTPQPMALTFSPVNWEQLHHQVKQLATRLQPVKKDSTPVIADFRVSAAPVIKARKERQAAYIQRYAAIAMAEMREYGIPASISLAQGMVESNAGASTLAVRNNNHFGLKCFSKKCHKGHCSNFTDDHHKDFFRIFNTPWASYRAHSILLSQGRYKPLHQLGTKNYREWAMGLDRLGYATASGYGAALIQCIEDWQLYKFDQ